jgi:hydroxymethylpyrimidine/phosphomethylpyrimidine kinase
LPRTTVRSPPQVLVVAGLDPGGGAGLLADAATLAAHDVRALGVITASTEQDSTGVRAVHLLPAGLVATQVTAIIRDARPRVVKLGMLGSLDIVRALVPALAEHQGPVIWDPVVMPTRGKVALFTGDPLEALELLAPRVTVITPNVPELELLADRQVDSPATQRIAATRLLALVPAVLAKGGHLPGDEVTDWLVQRSHEAMGMRGPRVTGHDLHGTGCVLASALAAELARGASLVDAFLGATSFVRTRLERLLATGQGARTLV